MIRGGIPIGKLFGISIRLHFSWFFIFALVTWALAASYFPTAYPGWSLTEKIVAGLLTSLLFFASVLVHELMHSLVAKSQGTQVASITLFILGGVSSITSEPKTPKDEFWMAIAGPGSSLVLGGIVWGIYFALRGMSGNAAEFVTAVAFWLGYINIALGVFNLIPGFPLDGGRVLRSLMWWSNHDLQKATKVASYIGRGVGYLFIAGGVYLVFTGNWFNGIWFALIGWFLESAAQGSYQQMILETMLKGHVAREVMSSECTFIEPGLTIEKLVNESILTSGRRCFPVVDNGSVLGMITLRNVNDVPREQWAMTTVRDAMTPMSKLKSVRPDEDLSSVLHTLVENDVNQVPVMQDRNILGMVARDNILRFVELRRQLGAPR